MKNVLSIFMACAMAAAVATGCSSPSQETGPATVTAAVDPAYGFLMGLMINARHLFYGISMLGKYRDVKRFKPYLIFALTDETFSVLCSEKVPRAVDREWAYLWVSVLNQCYWVLGSVLGSLVGGVITFNTKGLDFALTALFVVIFTDQWKSRRDHRPALVGVVSSVACLMVFGGQAFIIPAMVLILAGLSLWYWRNDSEIMRRRSGEVKEDE